MKCQCATQTVLRIAVVSTIVGAIDIRSSCNDKMNPTAKLVAAVIDTRHGCDQIAGVRVKLNITVGSSKNAMVESRPFGGDDSGFGFVSTIDNFKQ